MAKSQLKICYVCKRVFRAQNGRFKICDECAKHRSPHRRMRETQPSKAATLSIEQVSRIERIYNKVNSTFKHYGEIVNIIQGTKADCCVCCGDVVPEGRMICHECERKGENFL